MVLKCDERSSWISFADGYYKYVLKFCNINTDDIMALIHTNFIPKDLNTKFPNKAFKIRWPANVYKNVHLRIL